MTCGEYLALHSELLDERLDVKDELRCREHALSCASCARYDRVLRRGLRLVRELPAVTPSSQFLHRFQHRVLRTMESNGGGRSAASGTVLALAIAGVIAIAAWSPLLRLPDPADRADGDAAVITDVETGRDGRQASRVTPAARAPRAPIVRTWYDGSQASPAFTLTGARFSPGTSGSFPGLAPTAPGPYSPLIVSPPLQRLSADGSPRPGQ